MCWGSFHEVRLCLLQDKKDKMLSSKPCYLFFSGGYGLLLATDTSLVLFIADITHMGGGEGGGEGGK